MSYTFGIKRCHMTLTSHLHPLLNWRMHGAIPHSPMPLHKAWCLIKNGESHPSHNNSLFSRTNCKCRCRDTAPEGTFQQLKKPSNVICCFSWMRRSGYWWRTSRCAVCSTASVPPTGSWWGTWAPLERHWDATSSWFMLLLYCFVA